VTAFPTSRQGVSLADHRGKASLGYLPSLYRASKMNNTFFTEARNFSVSLLLSKVCHRYPKTRPPTLCQGFQHRLRVISYFQFLIISFQEARV